MDIDSIASDRGIATQTNTYILAGGGSGGHLYPGLAVAEALGQLDADATVLFLCTERQIDERILAASRFSFIPQPVVPLPRRLGQIVRFYSGWRASLSLCRGIMRQERPRAVLGLGGFASGPALKTAWKLRIPTALLNPDAVPGRANRFGRRYAERIFLQWPISRQYFGKDQSKCLVAGCPIRKGFLAADQAAGGYYKARAKIDLGLDPQMPLLVAMGGSQGGRNLNQALVACLRQGILPIGNPSPAVAETASDTAKTPAPAPGQAAQGDARPAVEPDRSDWQVLHLTGMADKNWVQKEYAEAGLGVQVQAFSDQMVSVLAAAELVIGRAGASSLAELTAMGLPSILLPYPYHKDRHQLHNAEVLAGAGAAVIVTDHKNSARTASELARVLGEILPAAKRAAMAQAARALAAPEAAETVARQVHQMAR
ncbi:MAG: UDP-N-acetylglucosamine--N-acetylmuramyl-(pentapeptide) pyrophosphoryl-undecaprenol N-acetylglucosamine transferase [Sedimentisphaerales bacterium]|nr:UDP-N-acetylglucosamine--N-acetylmuramyl-(pentapeptide) pyrophosphoryl-undecaprenol N-acetylglucosamine transferase [Sedimentisphaerales bacterium]